MKALPLLLLAGMPAAADERIAPRNAAAPGEPFPLVPAGSFKPLFSRPDDRPTAVAAFHLDATAVSNAQFQAFVAQAPQWSRERVRALFADPSYLSHWRSEAGQAAGPRPEDAAAPVTQVSWFAASAYCRAQGKRLPSTAEWELAAMADATQRDARRDAAYQRRILDWYAAPTPAHLPAVGGQAANRHGIRDLHGLVWEWTEDFNSVLSSGESRGDSATDNQFFCGSAAAGSANPADYASFMRYALRASLQARYTLANLGFRCAADPTAR